MEGLGDGLASDGSRGSAVSMAGSEDMFAGAIIPAGEDVHPSSNDGQQVRICVPEALITSERFFAANILLFVFQYLDPPNTLVPLTLKQVSMLTPSARHGGHYRCTGCLSARLKTNFMPVEDEHNLIDCCTFRTIDREYMQALREVR